MRINYIFGGARLSQGFCFYSKSLPWSFSGLPAKVWKCLCSVCWLRFCVQVVFMQHINASASACPSPTLDIDRWFASLCSSQPYFFEMMVINTVYKIVVHFYITFPPAAPDSIMAFSPLVATSAHFAFLDYFLLYAFTFSLFAFSI